MTKTHRSPGQNQVWKIAEQIIQEFALGANILHRESEHPAYGELVKRLKQDAIIRADRYTGCCIVEKEVANNYIRWLSATSREIESANGFVPNVNFDRMEFTGLSVVSPQEPERRIYQGGAKGSTARVVLGLIQGNYIYTGGMRISYFLDSNILSVTQGGNHRLLAYKLLGLSAIPSPVITVYQDRPNPRFNQALLCLESLHTHDDPRETWFCYFGNEEAIWRVAQEYGFNSWPKNPNELYRFTKYDFQRKVQRSNALQDPFTQQRKASVALNFPLLETYISAYHRLNRLAASWCEGGINRVVERLSDRVMARLFGPGQQPADPVDEVITNWQAWRAAGQPQASRGQPRYTIGSFVVHYNAGLKKPFTDYFEANKFYRSVPGPAALWDTAAPAELCHEKGGQDTP